MDVKKIIYKKIKELTKNKITDSSKIEDLGLDSLDLVELVTEAEEVFGIEISDEELNKLETVKDVINAFKKSKK